MTYNLTSDPNVWAIAGLVFVLGLLIGMFLTAGGRRKWRTRYRDETDRRVALEKEHAKHRAEWDQREQEYRERDSLSAAAVRDRRPATTRDTDGDGVPDDVDRRPVDDRKA